MSITGRLIRGVACVGVLAAFAVGAPGAMASPLFGFNDNSVSGTQLNATSSATAASGDGASSSRVTLDWAWVQPTPAAPNFGMFDAIYNADLARGIRPLFVLFGAPSWTWASGASCSAGSTCNYPPATSHNADWQTFVAQVAARYPKLAGIEIWNEPNQSWAWAGGLDPARYTQLLSLAYTAIKAVNPSVPVIGGALATDLGSTATSTSIPVQLFVQSMYDNGARGHMDGLSIHPYPGAMDWWYTYKAMSVTTEVRDANGDSVPLWITEFGMSTTDGWTEAQQALVDSNLLQPLLAYPGVAGVYIHTLIDPTSAPATSPERGYGVINANITPKPAYCDIANALHSGYVCPSGVAQPVPTTTQSQRWQAENLVQAAANAAIAWHNTAGTYQGLTTVGLHALDPRVSAVPLTQANPGPSADPSQIAVYQVAPSGLLLCNASQADRSYCIYTQYRSGWTYGMATGSVYQAAYNVQHGVSSTW